MPRDACNPQSEPLLAPRRSWWPVYLTSLPGVLAIFFVIHALAGLLYLWWLNPPTHEPFYDATLYIRGGQAILSGELSQVYYAKRLFQAFIAFGLAVFGEDIRGLRLLNFVSAVLTCQAILLTVQAITRRLRWVVAVGIILTFVPFQWAMVPYVLTEATYALFVAFIAWLLILMIAGLNQQQPPRWWLFAVLGVGLIILSEVRPIGWYLLVLVVPVLSWLIIRQRRSWRKRIGFLAAPTLMVAVYVAGETALQRVFETPQRSDSGETLWLGNMPTKYVGLYAPPLGQQLIQAGRNGPPEFREQVEKAYLSGLIPNSPPFDRLLRGYAIGNIRQDFADFLERSVHKLIAFLIIQIPEYLAPGTRGATSLAITVLAVVLAVSTLGGLTLAFVLGDWPVAGPAIILFIHGGIHVLSRARARDTLVMYPVMLLISVYFWHRVITARAPQNPRAGVIADRLVRCRLLATASCVALGCVLLHRPGVLAVQGFFVPTLGVEKIHLGDDRITDRSFVIELLTSQPHARVCSADLDWCTVTDSSGRGRLALPSAPGEQWVLRTYSKSGTRHADLPVSMPPRPDHAVGAEVLQGPPFCPPDQEGRHDFAVALRGKTDRQYVASLNPNPGTIVLKLAGETRLGVIQIVHYRRDIYMTDYSIEVSRDGIAWQEVAMVVDRDRKLVGDYPTSTHRLDRRVPCRFLRLHAIRTEGVNRMLLRQLSLYE